jgi:hypothetical protein
MQSDKKQPSSILVPIIGIIAILIFLVLSRFPGREYVSIDILTSNDASQLAETDGSDYYSWYDWDRFSGKVYLLTRSQSGSISVADAYGPFGGELFVKDLPKQ